MLYNILKILSFQLDERSVSIATHANAFQAVGVYKVTISSESFIGSDNKKKYQSKFVDIFTSIGFNICILYSKEPSH